ncbi:MAG TPA: VOC family protein [Gemmatimonadales bacterium]|jgi:catechol 2,3-dioxygenase-like lactoylglutathione lyase family enzyme|nr:VOC family protein [Gemmatimonadales bacterium]HZA97810.1 VOC family protein [Gemmatimonadales bacterium]
MSDAQPQRSEGTATAPYRRQQPETLRLRSIAPTFTVNDLQRSLAWYRDGLGFFISEKWEEGGKLEGVMLKAGACHFGLSQDDFSKGRDRPKGVGFRIWCETFQEVDALAARLRAFGGTILEEPGTRYDSYSFTAQDPDGFKITFAQAKS